MFQDQIQEKNQHDSKEAHGKKTTTAVAVAVVPPLALTPLQQQTLSRLTGALS